MRRVFGCSGLLLTAIACGRTAPPPPAPAPQPPAAVAMPAAPPAITTIDEARSLRANGKLDQYEAALQTLYSSEDAVTRRRALALLGVFELEQKKWDLAVPALMQAAD